MNMKRLARPWLPIVLAAEDDVGTVGGLARSARIVAVRFCGDAPEFRPTWERGAAFSPHLRDPHDVLAVFAASAEGCRSAGRIVAGWGDLFATPVRPALVDLTQGGAPDPPAAFAQLLAEHVRDLHARNAGLMRELAVLRTAHEETQNAFVRLESFFDRNNQGRRVPTTTLPVHRGGQPVVLRPGAESEQRLPTSSDGLSDVAISIHGKPKGASGLLHVSLELGESGGVVARWAVESGALTPGWLHLGLERALGPDPQTPILRLGWTGEEPLSLDTSFRHPDPRFMPMPGAPLLAMQVWKYVPAALSTPPAQAHLPTGHDVVERWNIGRALLRAAVPVAGAAGSVDYSEQFTGLQVMPVPDRPATARLDGCVHAGVRHLRGGIKIEDPDGPAVEFAYALHPTRLRADRQDAAPAPDPELMSEWSPLPPNEWSELHLFLTEPLQETHDLFLMTRLPAGEGCSGPPRACFFRITALAAPDIEA